MKIAVTALAISAVAGVALAQDAQTPQASADALYAEGAWAGAIAAYELLLTTEPSNAQNWFNLGQARHQQSDFASARDAYLKAIEHGFTPLPRVRYHLARAYASLGDKENALLTLEEIAQTGGPSHRLLESATEFEDYVDEPRFIAVLSALKPCDSDKHHAFDFWLGQWDVTQAGSAQPTAASSITSAQDGCVVFEQYSIGVAFTGMSINFYDSVRDTWHQTWMSNTGGAVYLEGGLNEDGAMVMTDKDHPASAASGSINRVTWTPRDDGSVRQFWQSSQDSGETWSTAFDGIYTLKVATDE